MCNHVICDYCSNSDNVSVEAFIRSEHNECYSDCGGHYYSVEERWRCPCFKCSLFRYRQENGRVCFKCILNTDSEIRDKIDWLLDEVDD